MASFDEIRARGIITDIYARHGIEQSMTPAEAALAISEKAPPPSAWANPEERAKARAEYASKGRTDREKQERWDKSIYLMDPDTHKNTQSHGRDIDFLIAAHDADSIKDDPTAQYEDRYKEWVPSVEDKKRAAISTAVSYWDSSNSQPLSRESWLSPKHQSEGGVLAGLRNATQNPDILAANAMTAGEVIPDRIRMGGSGEARTGTEAWNAAQAKRLAANRYRLDSPHPVLDLPDGATPEQRAARIKELQELTGKAAVPSARQRWASSTGAIFGKENAFVPPGWITDPLDVAVSAADPTAAIPVGGALGAAGKVGMKALAVAGKGWVKPLLSSLLKKTAFGTASDQLVEQGVGHGISTALGGDPDRSLTQFAMGEWGGVPQKSESEVRDSQEAREKIFADLKDEDRLSRADKGAYKSLGISPFVY